MDNIEIQEENLNIIYKTDLSSMQERIADAVKQLDNDSSKFSIQNIQTLSSTVIAEETDSLRNEIEELFTQKEHIEKMIEKKSQALQDVKYQIFNTIEEQFGNENEESLVKLHQIKLQTIDLFDLLSEIVESAIISSLEKDFEVENAIEEVIREISFEAIKEGSLNTIRIRKILSTILQSSIEVAEASPVKAHSILAPTLKGMRSGLLRSITRFKQRLVFIPLEAKHILIEDYDTIIEDLHQTDTLFAQVVKVQAENSSSEIQRTLELVNSEMKYDLEELLRTSKETAELMKERFATLATKTMKKADNALNSQKAQEAKRIGKQALGIAKTAIDSALKSAKDAIDKK